MCVCFALPGPAVVPRVCLGSRVVSCCCLEPSPVASSSYCYWWLLVLALLAYCACVSPPPHQTRFLIPPRAASLLFSLSFLPNLELPTGWKWNR